MPLSHPPPSSCSATAATADPKERCSGCSGDEAVRESSTLSACVPRSWIGALNVLLVAIAAAVVINTLQELSHIRSSTDPDLLDEKLRIIGSAVSTAGILLWPVLWNSLIGFSILTHAPLTLVGFLWPLLLTAIDLANSANARGSIPAQRVFGLSNISADTSTILSLTFSVGLLLTSLQSSKSANATVPLLFYGLIILAALILPVPALNPNTPSGFAVAATQRIAINYTLGVIIAALTLNVSDREGNSLREAFYSVCSGESS